MISLIIKSAIFLQIFAAAFDPIGEIYIRYIALAYTFFTLLVCLFFKFTNFKTDYLTLTTIFYFAILLPVYGLLVSSFRGGLDQQLTDTANISSGIVILFTLIFLGKKNTEYGLSVFVFILRILSVLILISGLILFFYPRTLFTDFLIEKSIAALGRRMYGGFPLPYIFFISSPMLVYLVYHDFYKFFTVFINKSSHKRIVIFTSLIAALTSAISLFLSGTRSHQLIALTSPIIISIMVTKKLTNRLIFIGIFALIISVGLIFSPNSTIIVYDAFSASEANNSFKLNLLSGYNQIFMDPTTLIFGQGINAHVWSKQLRDMIAIDVDATKTELTLLEIFRVYGFFIGSFFVSHLIILTRKLGSLNKNFKWIMPAFIAYLFNALSNPYLFSTNGIIPISIFLALLRFRKYDSGSWTNEA